MLRATAFLILVFLSGPLKAQQKGDYLRLVYDAAGRPGYTNLKGDTVIPCGKYLFCFTEKFRNWAIVNKKRRGWVGIDRKEQILFDIHVMDNGPDDPSDGLFRILRNGKIGYADLNGHIVIQPQYDCAYPFERKRAFVGLGCETKLSGEYHYWCGGSWQEIDKHGKLVRRLKKNPRDKACP